jgi:NAD-dependent deacetylase
MQTPDPKDVADIASALKKARNVLVITGAGMSAESGLPTYRGLGGLYEDASTDEGIEIEDALSGPMFQARPEITWKYIGQIERACRGARHNRAHEIVAELEKKIERLWVLTQNVDGFHRDAGSKNLIEIHGNLRHLECTRCGETSEVADYSSLELPPRCGSCGGLVRPKVVLFGEMLPRDQIAVLERELMRGFDIVFSIGTSSLFPYIAQPVVIARRMGRTAVEINPGETPVSRFVTHRLACGAVAGLEAIVSAYEGAA